MWPRRLTGSWGCAVIQWDLLSLSTSLQTIWTFTPIPASKWVLGDWITSQAWIQSLRGIVHFPALCPWQCPSPKLVFLDYDAGTVSFYNVTNHGSPIYTFSKYYFPTTLVRILILANCVSYDSASPKLLNILSWYLVLQVSPASQFILSFLLTILEDFSLLMQY